MPPGNLTGEVQLIQLLQLTVNLVDTYSWNMVAVIKRESWHFYKMGQTISYTFCNSSVFEYMSPVSSTKISCHFNRWQPDMKPHLNQLCSKLNLRNGCETQNKTNWQQALRCLERILCYMKTIWEGQDKKLTFRQDQTPSHYTFCVWRYLTETFSDRYHLIRYLRTVFSIKYLDTLVNKPPDNESFFTRILKKLKPRIIYYTQNKTNWRYSNGQNGILCEVWRP